MESSAIFSRCRTWRYVLLRRWDERLPGCVFILLNPSTADETTDDPTLRRGIGFAKRWGCGSVLFVNLFAYRAAEPKQMKAAPDPIGPGNDSYILGATAGAAIIVAAWGVHGTYRNRDSRVKKLLRECKVSCLGKTKDGQPKHPLYVKADTELEPFDTRTFLQKWSDIIGEPGVKPEEG